MERNEPREQVSLLHEHKAIDDRAPSEKELSWQLLSTLDLLNDGILIIGHDSRITYANAEMVRVLSKQELTGKNIFEVNLDGVVPKFFNFLKIALAEQKKTTLMEYVPPLKKWYNINIYPSPAFIAIVFQDTSGLERLDELYKLTHYTIENAQEYVMWVAMDGRLSYVNEPTRSKLGYAMAAMSDYKIYDIIKALSPDSWDAFRDEVVSRRSMMFESAIVNVYGKKIIGDVTANHVKLKEKEYIVVFVRDTSLRKKAENELRSSKAQAELYLDLMCHDINNINQVGLGFLELAMETVGQEEPVRDYLDKTMESLHRSTDLIDNVKKLQSSKSGLLQIRPMDLGSIIDKVVGQYSDHYDREVNIRFISTGKYNVMANDLMKDVFDNLIGNSIKHSTGPLTIDIGIDKVRENHRDFYRIRIDDNGPGIPDIVKNSIFDRSDIRRISAAGKGFGLYLVKTLVSDFKGGVWVEDRVPGDYKQGCRFVIMLPVADGKA